jgi:D-amino peptidase
LFAQDKKRIFVITDAEGVAGVCRQDQTDPRDPDMPALLTGEVNAAVEGFFEGGADEVTVLDGHGGSSTLSALRIHPRARLVFGVLPAALTFERRYSAIAFVGQHAMANTRNAVMGHSFDSLHIQYLKLNGKPVGEIEPIAAMAGNFGTPVIFLSGDQAAADEVRALIPQISLAVVKQGLGRYTCDTLSAESARALIREKARASMALLGHIAPYRINGPVTIEVEHSTRNSLGPDAAFIPNTEIVDDRTIRYHGSSFFEAWMRYQRGR